MAGIWELTYKTGDTSQTAMLTISADNEGELSAKWKSGDKSAEISDLNYERGTLSFKCTSGGQGEAQKTTMFSGTVDRQTNTLEGTLTGPDGTPSVVQGKRSGEALIGTWNLDVTGEQRQFKQQLRVNPDMSALYGTQPIEKIELKDGAVSFKATWQFGDRSFEMSFEGKVADDTLTGQLTTSRGTQEVKGTKVVRRGRRSGGGQ